MLFHIDSAKSALEKKKKAEKIHNIIEVDLSAFVYFNRLFHEDFSPIIGTNLNGNSAIFML